MSCQCYQIGGPFIAEDPNCPVHGREREARVRESRDLIHKYRAAKMLGTPVDVEAAVEDIISYLESME